MPNVGHKGVWMSPCYKYITDISVLVSNTLEVKSSNGFCFPSNITSIGISLLILCTGMSHMTLVNFLASDVYHRSSRLKNRQSQVSLSYTYSKSSLITLIDYLVSNFMPQSALLQLYHRSL